MHDWRVRRLLLISLTLTSKMEFMKQEQYCHMKDIYELFCAQANSVSASTN